MNKYPDLKSAISLWQESLTGILSASPSEKIPQEYISHSTGVALAALKIAEKAGMNKDKAYVLGLLHDYGKIQNEKQSGIAHFIVGYEKMMSLGYTDVARICLSHSFPNADFDFADYTSYSEQDLMKAKQELKKIVLDDYDRLIQLCDIFFEANSIVSYQKRIKCIIKRYNLSQEQTKNLEENASKNKTYFDNRCQCDIYQILGIKE